MPATDYATLLDTRVWALLEKHKPFTSKVRLSDRLKLDRRGMMPKPVKQPADVPEVTVDIAGSIEDVFTADEHFGQEAGEGYEQLADDCWLETSTYSLRVTLVFDDDRLQPANQLAAELKAALRAGGPTLGFEWVARWGPLQRADSIESTGDAAAGRRRRIVRVMIPVRVEADGDTLIPPAEDRNP